MSFALRRSMPIVLQAVGAVLIVAAAAMTTTLTVGWSEMHFHWWLPITVWLAGVAACIGGHSVSSRQRPGGIYAAALAAWGFWVVSWPLRFHRVTRHDGYVSVLRGFTVDELARHVLVATGQQPDVRRHLGYRITATWRPRGAAS